MKDTMLVPLALTTGGKSMLGAKGYQLKLLLDAGLPVPETWVLTANSSDRFLAARANGVEQRALFKDLHLHLSALVQQQAPGSTFAVRSSHPLEDGGQSSFAGQFLTELNMRQAGTLAQSVLRCWEQSLQVDVQGEVETQASNPIPCCVLVQKMVPSQCSGVLFLQDDHMHVSATWGMALGVVDGSAGVESWTLTRSSLACELLSNHKDQVVVPVQGRTNPRPGTTLPCLHLPDQAALTVTAYNPMLSVTQVQLSAELQSALCLGPASLVDLYHHAVKAAAALGLEGCDMEWAITPEGEVVVLQARPITRQMQWLSSQAGAQGLGLVAGQATGQAHKVNSEQSAREFPAGALLVAQRLVGPSLRAAQKAAGCIVESRSPLSHSAIIARELGIPAVSCFDIATIEDGGYYQIDGKTGMIQAVAEVPSSTEPLQDAPMKTAQVTDPRPALLDLAYMPWVSHAPVQVAEDCTLDCRGFEQPYPGVLADWLAWFEQVPPQVPVLFQTPEGDLPVALSGSHRQVMSDVPTPTDAVGGHA